MHRLIASVAITAAVAACSETANAPQGSLMGSCASQVEDALGMLYSYNNESKQAPAALRARLAEIAAAQCGCAERTLSEADYRSLHPEATTSYSDGGAGVVTVRESAASEPEKRDRINAQLDASCPGETL
ncbi:MAG: hypothetical protein ACT4OF_11950 [Caulobacteraceae bacterium]